MLFSSSLHSPTFDVLGLDVYPIPHPWPCPWPFSEPHPLHPEFCPHPANLAWGILDLARSQLKINVGRRGTNWAQSPPDLDWCLDVLQKHTTVDSAPGCLSRRRIVKMINFKLWLLDFTKPNPCAHMLSCIGETSLQNRQKTKESLGNIRIFLLLKPNFTHTKFDFLELLSAFFNGFTLSSTAFWFSSLAFQFSSMAFYFLRNWRKSIYGKKYTKDHYLSFVFFCHLLSHLRSVLFNTRYNTQHFDNDNLKYDIILSTNLHSKTGFKSNYSEGKLEWFV